MSSGLYRAYCEWLALPNVPAQHKRTANHSQRTEWRCPMSHADTALTPPAIARRYGIHVSRVLAWIRSGQLAAINVGDGTRRPRWRILPDALEAFERRRAAQPAAKATQRRKVDPTITQYF